MPIFGREEKRTAKEERRNIIKEKKEKEEERIKRLVRLSVPNKASINVAILQ